MSSRDTPSGAPATKVPLGRLTRGAQLARMGARAALGLATRRDPAELALRAAESLGELRGLGAKIGQMTGYLEGVLPEGSEAAFERAMTRLRTQTRTSPREAVLALLTEELGAPPEQLFARFDEEPFASASIGQVHRARMHDGREVAVKVQHPGIGDAFAADLENVGLVSGFTSVLGASRLGAREMLRIARERFLEELDYGLEAEHQERIRELWQGDATIVVPAVVRERSAARVLTTELLEGAHAGDAEVIAKRSIDRRVQHASDVFRFTTTTWLEDGWIWADPHTGNVLLLPDGRTAFLDYGCMQAIPKGALAAMRTMHTALAAGEVERFRDAVREALAQRRGAFDDVLAEVVRSTLSMLEAATTRLTQRDVRELSRRTLELKQRSFTTLRDAQPMPGFFVFVMRMLIGRLAMLAAFDAPVAYPRLLPA